MLLHMEKNMGHGEWGHGGHESGGEHQGHHAGFERGGHGEGEIGVAPDMKDAPDSGEPAAEESQDAEY
jgi:hypothetical protein